MQTCIENPSEFALYYLWWIQIWVSKCQVMAWFCRETLSWILMLV